MKINLKSPQTAKKLAVIAFLILSVFHSKINAQVRIWDKRFGGSSWDVMSSIVSTTDGGYLLGGSSESGIGGDKTQSSRGYNDYWAVRIDTLGNKIWDKRFGGIDKDDFSSMIACPDGGFLLGGSSLSRIGGDKTQSSWGYTDFWVVKIDALGNKLWDKRFGGTAQDDLSCIVACPDGGFLLGGSSDSGISGDKTQPSWGWTDYWIVKIDASGNKLWDKRYGGILNDNLEKIFLSPDGGFILGGSSFSGIGGDKTQSSRGDTDYWVVKIDASGNKLWDKRFGGTAQDDLSCIVAYPDGNLLLGGSSMSDIGGDKTQSSWGHTDFWVVKIDISGNKIWDKRYGANNQDFLVSIEPTPDSGFILGGHADPGSSEDMTELYRGVPDYWILKIDGYGNRLWDKRFGGAGHNRLFCISKVSPSFSHILLGGYSNAGISEDKTQDCRGSNDYWVVKMTTTPLILSIPDFVIACSPICPFTDFDIRSRYFTNIASFNVRVRVPRGKAAFNASGHSYNQSLQSPVIFKVENDSTLLVTWKNTKNVSLPNDASLFKTSVKILSNSTSFKACVIDAQAFDEKGVKADISSLCGNISFKNTPNKEAASKTKEIQTQFNIYPNPGTEVLYLTLPQSSVEYQIELSNPQGKILRKSTSKNQENQNTQTIDLQGLPPGLYLIKIYDGKNSFNSKIIKQ